MRGGWGAGAWPTHVLRDVPKREPKGKAQGPIECARPRRTHEAHTDRRVSIAHSLSSHVSMIETIVTTQVQERPWEPRGKAPGENLTITLVDLTTVL